jgi:hypothetical protein
LTESSRDALAETPAEESNAGASTEPVEAPTESQPQPQPQPQPQTQSTAITGAEADPAPTSSAAGSWPTVVPPRSAAEESQDIVAEVAVEPEQEVPPTTGSFSQIGEAVIREVLGGELISEHPVEQEKEA